MSDKENATVPSADDNESPDEEKKPVAGSANTDPDDGSAPDLLPGSLPVDEPGPPF